MHKLLIMLSATLFMACGSNADGKKVTKVAESPKENGSTVKHITKAEYQKLVYDYEKNPQSFVYEGDLPAIVDFYAEWCGPCKRVAPILEKMAQKYSGKIRIYKVDVDKEKELAGAHGIQSIPTMIFFPKNGQPQVVQGALPEDKIEEAIQKILLAAQAK